MRGFQKLELESEQQRERLLKLETLGKLGEDSEYHQYQMKESRNDSAVPRHHA